MQAAKQLQDFVALKDTSREPEWAEADVFQRD